MAEWERDATIPHDDPAVQALPVRRNPEQERLASSRRADAVLHQEIPGIEIHLDADRELLGRGAEFDRSHPEERPRLGRITDVADAARKAADAGQGISGRADDLRYRLGIDRY